MPRRATIVFAGPPNSGKSTLLNALVGEPLSITSSKPQSTTRPVVGIRSETDTQLVFIDPPGLLEPRSTFHRSLVSAAHEVLSSADVILQLHRADLGPAPPLSSLLQGIVPAGQALVLTQIDRISRPPARGTETFPVSAVTGEGLDRLLDWCRQMAREGDFRFPSDEISSQPTHFFVSEYVREAAFDQLHEELPYAIATEVDEFREGSSPLYIRVTIYVERNSQRAIVIGTGGQMLRSIGMAARKRLEALLGQHTFLDLRVKVLPNWRSNPRILRRFGFPALDKESR